MDLKRREFIKSSLIYTSAAVAGTQFVPGLFAQARAEQMASDHLFVQIQIEGSADMICSLDPKLEMPGLSESEFYREYFDADIKGDKIKLGPAGYPLLPYLNEMVVINGINTQLDSNTNSHEDCRTYCASGAQGQSQFSTGVVEVAANGEVGPFGVIINTPSWFVNKRANISQAMTDNMGASTIDPHDSRFILSPLPVSGDPYEDSLNAYINSVNAVNDYNSKLETITKLMNSENSALDFELRVAAALSSGLGNQGFLNFGGDYLSKILPGYKDLDSHSNYKKVHQESQTKYWDRLARTFETFKKLEYKQSGKSLFEMTTFLVTNEFSKTPGMVGDGKDHNPKNNSAIIAGRGINGGQSIGRSRFFSVKDWPNNLNRTQMVAMPIDFKTGASLADEDLKKLQDLASHNSNIRMIKPENVMATVLDVLNIPQSKFKNFSNPNVKVIPTVKK
jgi:hypothetical protein